MGLWRLKGTNTEVDIVGRREGVARCRYADGTERDVFDNALEAVEARPLPALGTATHDAAKGEAVEVAVWPPAPPPGPRVGERWRCERVGPRGVEGVIRARRGHLEAHWVVGGVEYALVVPPDGAGWERVAAAAAAPQPGERWRHRASGFVGVVVADGSRVRGLLPSEASDAPPTEEAIDDPAEWERVCEGRYGGLGCTLAVGHAGEHREGDFRWGGATCGAASGPETCALAPGHGGDHRAPNGVNACVTWPQVDLDAAHAEALVEDRERARVTINHGDGDVAPTQETAPGRALTLRTGTADAQHTKEIATCATHQYLYPIGKDWYSACPRCAPPAVEPLGVRREDRNAAMGPEWVWREDVGCRGMWVPLADYCLVRRDAIEPLFEAIRDIVPLGEPWAPALAAWIASQRAAPAAPLILAPPSPPREPPVVVVASADAKPQKFTRDEARRRNGARRGWWER